MAALMLSLLAILALYALLVVYLLVKTILPARQGAGSEQKELKIPGVSIVVPFRNEAIHLEKMLESLETQDFGGPIEILLMNDGSTDDSVKIINSRTWSHPVRVIDSAYSPEQNLTSKQQAIERGINEAAYDRIALTDADMVLCPDWLSSLTRPAAAAGVSMLFGHTIIEKDRNASLFKWFQAYQLELLFTTAYSFSRAGLRGSCMGNNVLISRESYRESGGFKTTGYSITEDCALLSAFVKKRLSTAPTEPFAPTAATFPAASLDAYASQLLRWIRGGFSCNPWLLLSGLIFASQNLLFLLGIFGALPADVSLAAYGNSLLTWFFVSIVFRKIRSRESALMFWPFYVLLLAETLILPCVAVWRSGLSWKGRRI